MAQLVRAATVPVTPSRVGCGDTALKAGSGSGLDARLMAGSFQIFYVLERLSNQLSAVSEMPPSAKYINHCVFYVLHAQLSSFSYGLVNQLFVVVSQVIKRRHAKAFSHLVCPAALL